MSSLHLKNKQVRHRKGRSVPGGSWRSCLLVRSLPLELKSWVICDPSTDTHSLPPVRVMRRLK
jgi:hypothetical protein